MFKLKNSTFLLVVTLFFGTCSSVLANGSAVHRHTHETTVSSNASVNHSAKTKKVSKRPRAKESLCSKSAAKMPEEAGCFLDCLANSVPPDVVLTCAEACANGNYGTCAICLGVGVGIVISCARL